MISFVLINQLLLATDDIGETTSYSPRFREVVVSAFVLIRYHILSSLAYGFSVRDVILFTLRSETVCKSILLVPDLAKK